jgi:hypothetical protein
LKGEEREMERRSKGARGREMKRAGVASSDNNVGTT